MFSPDQWAASTGVAFYNGVATQSLRLNGVAENTTLYRDLTATGNRRTATITFWMKNDRSDPVQYYWSKGDGGGAQTSFQLFTHSDSTFSVYAFNSDSQILNLRTNRVFRDASAWYHFVVAVDTTQATASDRVKLYINGVQETSFSTASYMSQNTDTVLGLFSSNKRERLGDYQATYTVGSATGGSAGNRVNGYFSDFYYIDGSQLDPTSFGEFKNGVWIPIEYTGSYGTNGYRLEFKQTGTGTASSSTIGADTSGNDNHWTTSNVSAEDSNMPDSPENNFSTLNPLQIGQSNWTLSEANLKGVSSTSVSGGGGVLSTMGVSSGKWYWECLLQNLNSDSSEIGIANTNSIRTDVTLGRTSDSYAYLNNGNKFSNNSSSSYGATYTTGDIIGVALDLDGGTLTFYKNNASQGTAFSSLPSGYYVMGVSEGSTGNQQTQILNFGQDSSFAGNKTAQGNTDANGIGDFYYSPPSGYLALCTANLPEPTISPNEDTQADDHFNTVIYDGNNDATRTFDIGFVTDFAWFKARNQAGYGHNLYDSVRGVQKYLQSNTSGAEITNTEGVTDFDDNGLLKIGTDAFLNESGTTMVLWNWKAGGTAVSNTDGTITSSVSANTDAGFSIVTYTGNGTGGATVGHGLGKTPNVFLIKNRTDNGSNWNVYHSGNTSAPETESIALNTNDAGFDSDTRWNDTLPTSTVFSIGTSNQVNGSSDEFIAYCFAEIEGYSKFGSYTGSSAPVGQGTFIYLGFRPSLVILRDINGGSWGMFDATRNAFNVTNKHLTADTSDAEYSGDTNRDMDFLSNGFKLMNAYPSGLIYDNSARQYIYIAFAENPFKYANAR